MTITRIILYGHIRRASFYRHYTRLYSQAEYYMHTWDHFDSAEMSWWKKKSLPQSPLSLSQDYIAKASKSLNTRYIKIESQHTPSINSIPAYKRKYYSLSQALCYPSLLEQKEPCLVSRPDVIHHYNIVQRLTKLQDFDNKIYMGFDISPGSDNSNNAALGSTDLILFGRPSTLYRLSMALLNNPADNRTYSDFQYMQISAQPLGIDLVLTGIINERDFHLWRITNRYRLRSLWTNLLDHL